MIFQKEIFIHLGIVLIIWTFQDGQVEGVRLCGKRLADLLNFICERHGGFHAPREKRAVSSSLLRKPALIEFLRPMSRRTDPEQNGDIERTPLEEATHFQQGIVDECCKKQCSVSTLASYCANAPQQVGDINLEGMLPIDTLEEPTLSDEDLNELEYQRITSGFSSGDDSSNDQLASENPSANHPNLGLSNRNRPVFIVLSQATEEER